MAEGDFEVGFQAPVESVDELFDEIDRCACLGLEPVISAAAWLLGCLALWVGSERPRSRVSLESRAYRNKTGEIEYEELNKALRVGSQGLSTIARTRSTFKLKKGDDLMSLSSKALQVHTLLHPPSFLRPSHTLASSLCHLQRRERVSGEKGKQKKKTFKQMEEEEAARKV